MPSHQDRRAPLPADYQYPTHGVDCDCPPCRDSIIDMRSGIRIRLGRCESQPIRKPVPEEMWGV